ncbi:hypothetical protein AA0313_1948 [Acetobacter indonesiensis NRIC 0313]|nr:hypothetical protein AA0313_1948 [Acetobacter indonesiensis NRIC 0313]
MKLTPQAAMSVCKSAAKRGVLIWRIEGGIKHLPSTEFPCGAFEARLDCIWDGPNPPMSMQEAAIVNRQAYDFIKEESLNHNAFIITATEVNKNYNRS